MNATEQTHEVKIVKENHWGDCYFVARDARGEWRTRGLCSLCLGTEGVPLVESLYHKEEIVSVQVRDGVTTAVIRGS
jgi:hypothetical protein